LGRHFERLSRSGALPDARLDAFLGRVAERPTGYCQTQGRQFHRRVFCGNDRAKRAAVEALTRYAFQELGCVHLEFSDLQINPTDVAGLGFETRAQAGYVADLRPDEDQILHNMQAKSARYSIRKAAKLGVVVEEARDELFADEYYAQLREVFASQGLTPTYDRRRTLLLMRHLLPTGNLLLLRARAPDGGCIATGIFLGMNRRAYFWGNASWHKYRHFCPNEALHWYAMQYWKRRGMECYDMCGAGLYKRKYGCRPFQSYFLWKSRFGLVRMARNVGEKCFQALQHLEGRLRRRQFFPRNAQNQEKDE
jgi:hypothetical protein